LVVLVDGYDVEHLVVVQQQDTKPVGRDPGQHPVVGAAASAEPVSGRVTGQPGADHDIRIGDGLDAERLAGRLADAEPRRAKRSGLVGRPA
jgi:hypothetical protein